MIKLHYIIVTYGYMFFAGLHLIEIIKYLFIFVETFYSFAMH